MFLYAKGTNHRISVPSQVIDDIKLSEDAYKADFELGKRYHDFVKEVIRFSLLGIAGYAFLIEHVVGTPRVALMGQGAMPWIVVAGILILSVAAGLGLYLGQLNRGCLDMQVKILRLLQRRESPRWTDPYLSSDADVLEWKKRNESDLLSLRGCQAQTLNRMHRVQMITVWLLILGIVVTAIVFVQCLHLNTRAASLSPPLPEVLQQH
jgi:hypothetical protein